LVSKHLWADSQEKFEGVSRMPRSVTGARPCRAAPAPVRKHLRGLFPSSVAAHGIVTMPGHAMMTNARWWPSRRRSTFRRSMEPHTPAATNAPPGTWRWQTAAETGCRQRSPSCSLRACELPT